MGRFATATLPSSQSPASPLKSNCLIPSEQLRQLHVAIHKSLMTQSDFVTQQPSSSWLKAFSFHWDMSKVRTDDEKIILRILLVFRIRIVAHTLIDCRDSDGYA